jgi:hypothetical protein
MSKQPLYPHKINVSNGGLSNIFNNLAPTPPGKGPPLPHVLNILWPGGLDANLIEPKIAKILGGEKAEAAARKFGNIKNKVGRFFGLPTKVD